MRAYNTRMRQQIKSLLRAADTNPVLTVAAITPLGYMSYVVSRRHQGHGGYLSKSAYGSIRAALFHLFHLHNRSGFSDSFRLELGNLFKGFYRSLTRQQREAQSQEQGNQEQQQPPEGNPNRNTSGVKEGKDPMSVELYKKVCHWFLDWGTLDGVFAHCFLVLTWNLACRSSNTTHICLSEVEWGSTFDTFEIFFAHTKTDQTGKEAKYSRHLYANPHCPVVCPVLALAMYFTCSFNTPQCSNNYLFPGDDQYQRFLVQLRRVFQEHRDEVSLLGADPSEIGTHSIRKGAVTYLASIPGGPAIAAVCIHAGWTMGTVKDIYLRYLSSGDQFVGRCLSLLPLLRVEFASSPPHFVPAWEDWGNDFRQHSFPMISPILHLKRLTLMCSSSIVYHCKFIAGTLAVNHVIHMSGHLFRNADLLQHVSNGNGCVVVSFPWMSIGVHVFTGIPPHVAVLQELDEIKTQQQGLIDSFIDKVKQAIDECGLAGGALSEHRLCTIFDGFAEEICGQLGQVGNNNGAEQQVAERVENGNGYRWHCFDGQFHRVPKDWRFPRVGVFDIWKHWWIGDSVRGVPPLRMLSAEDIKFLDQIPISQEELHARTGANRNRRRLSRKTLCDLKFLMEYITKKVQDANQVENVITPTSVMRMFEVVAEEFQGGQNSQKKWHTVANELRVKQRQMEEQQNYS